MAIVLHASDFDNNGVKFNITSGYIGLIYSICLSPYPNRTELSRVNLPSVRISNAIINITGTLSTLYLFRLGSPYNNNVFLFTI